MARFVDGRAEDGSLVAMIDLALILIYLCSLLIKTCDMSAVGTTFRGDATGLGKVMCNTFGFGETPDGEPMNV